MKSVCQKIICTILVIVFSVSTNVSIAVTQSEIDKQKNQQSEINGQIDENEEKQKEIEAKKSEVVKQVENISSQIENYESEIDNLDSQIDDANTKIKEAETKLTQAEDDYKKQEEMLKQRLVAIYVSGETSYLDFLLSSKSLTDFISSYYLVSEITDMDTQLLEKIQKQKEEIETSKKEIENSKQKLTDAKVSKESVSNQLKSAKSEKNTYVAKLSEEEAKLQKEIDELKEHENSVKNKINQMQKEYDSQETPQNNNSNNGSSSYGFGWPVTNHTVGTVYGVSGPYWSSGYHTGIDFPVSSGTSVYAVGNGQVFDTGYNSAYGNFVEIYHGNNIYSFYAHASSVQVNVGQKVSKGQQIMLSGRSGNVTGAHLHFEIRTPGYKYANCVNPRGYLPQ